EARLLQVSATSVNRWAAGARPRTLPAAVVPVVVETAAASAQAAGLSWGGGAGAPAEGSVSGWRAVAGRVASLAIQVGTNYANDYHDGIRGTDDVRVGPVRLVASGLASPGSVRAAAVVAFGVAGVAGLALAAATTWW